MTVLSPSTTGVSTTRVAADVAVAAEDRAVDDARRGRSSCSARRSRRRRSRAFVDVASAADHAVRADARAGLDHRAVVDEARALRARRRPRPAPRARSTAVPRRAGERRRREAAVDDVAVHLQVLLRRADVDPVAAIDVGDERLAALDQRREVAALDRPGVSFGMRSNVSGSST